MVSTQRTSRLGTKLVLEREMGLLLRDADSPLRSSLKIGPLGSKFHILSAEAPGS